MMPMYEVTIGIPVYRACQYIEDSLLSALNQTFLSIEFLIVDDKGGDGSMDIVVNLQKNHPQGKDIRILVNDMNSGVSYSRNRIIDEAKGRYLYFMDSDDTIAKNTIELLMRNARQYEAEVVFGSYQKIDTSGKKTVYQYPSKQLLGKDELAGFAYRKYAGIQASACNYIVKTDILRVYHHRFIDVNYWEDLVFTFDLVTLVSRAVLLPDITYIYICRENSLSHYQERINISKSEVMQNVEAIEHLKCSSVSLCNKEYFPSRCFNIVMTDFYIVCNILKRRKSIFPHISNKEIKMIMNHPAKWTQICSFKQSRIKNMLLYSVGILSSSLCVSIIWIVGKFKKLI